MAQEPRISPEMPVSEVLERWPATLAVFVAHGVDPHVECPGDVIDFPIEDCEWMCTIHDIEALVEKLNAAVAAAGE